MKLAFRFAMAVTLALVLLASAHAADWPGFRGDKGGAADDKELPVKLTKDNILWKVKVPGPGASSPITFGDKIFLTCYTGYGSKITKGFSGGFGGGGGGGFGKGTDTGGDQKKLKLVLLCLDRKTGDQVWRKEIKPNLPEEPFAGMIREHGYASSTPVTDGERVYVFFGKTGVFAFDMDGNQLWQKSVGTKLNTMGWGSAASPILHKNLVIVNAAIESGALVALDKKTGDEVWRVKGLGTTWSSPIVVETKDGKHEVVMSLPGKVYGYDAEKGTELWNCQGIAGGGFGGGYTSSTPVAKDGIVYVIGGGGGMGKKTSTALAVKAGGKGNVTKTHMLWRVDKGTGTSSPVLVGDKLCWVAGFVTAVNTADGETAGNKRLYDSKGEYVSPVASGDKIYALTRFDGLFVLDGGGKFEQIAHLEFAGDDSIFNASPAISDGRLYVRSNAYLYCIGKKAEANAPGAKSALNSETGGGDFTSLFNGKDLDGWDGDAQLWSVKDGEIVGKHPEDKTTNRYLCTKEKYSDFILHVSWKLMSPKGNSGVQIRSEPKSNLLVAGFQVEIAPANTGGIFEELGRGWMAKPNAAGLAAVKITEWNTYVITAKGDQVAVSINGVPATELKDEKGRKAGVIALQHYQGEVRFKDIKLIKLDAK